MEFQSQFCKLGERYLFAGTPSLKLSEIEEFGLDLRDLTPLDATSQFLNQQGEYEAQLDVLEQRFAELEGLHQQNEQVSIAEQQLAYDLSSAGDILLTLSESGVILDCRLTNSVYLPVSPAEIIGKEVQQALPFLNSCFSSVLQQLQDGKSRAAVSFSIENEEQKYFFVGRVALTVDRRVLLLAEDVTEKTEWENRLQFEANHDNLTGLPNRRYFMKHVRNSLLGSHSTALISIDLDRFKEINDFHGHHVGDLVIAEVSQRLRRLVSRDMVVARIGGDEFAILYRLNLQHGQYGLAELKAADEQLEKFCCRISAVVMNPIKIGDLRICLRASFGIATQHETNTDTPEVLLRNADLAINRAKSADSSSKKMVFFTRDLQVEYFERRRLLEDLEKAINAKEIIAYYQPIIDIDDQSTVAIEALARWVHVERGFVNPSEFIPLAEESNQICQIGEIMLQTACEEAMELNRYSPGLSVNVNLSAVQIQSSDIVAIVSRVLEETKLPPNLLTLEVTESLMLKDLSRSTRLLQGLRRLGCKIALDDFGIGYSSLAYLEKLPIDILKLDRLFVKKLNDKSTKQKKIVHAIVDLGHALGLKIVCEGIETIDQQECLKQFGCRYIQGYLHSRPVPLHELKTFLDPSLGQAPVGIV